jgi:NADH:ubiquinone oxidoreductase subunit K
MKALRPVNSGEHILRSLNFPNLPRTNMTSDHSQLEKHCFRGVSLILWTTGLLKLLSAFASAGILSQKDPLLAFLTVRELLLSSAFIEIVVAIILWRERHASIKPLVTIWIASMFSIYRLGLWLIAYKGSCPCLGTIGDWIPIPHKLLDHFLLSTILFMYTIGIIFVDYGYITRSRASQLPSST